MAKETTKNTVKRDCVIAIIGLIVIAFGTIKSIIATDFKSFLIYYAITIIGVIVIVLEKESLRLQISKKDKLD